MSEYYIICKRHMYKKDFAVLFWGPDYSGYRYNVNDAGVYTEEEIKRFDKDHYCDDMPISKKIIDDFAVDMVIDNAKLGKVCLNTQTNRKAFGIKMTELHSGETHWDKRAFCEPKQFLRFNENTLNIINQIKMMTA